MKHEHSAGAIIWRKKNNEIQYLLIQSQPYKQVHGLFQKDILKLERQRKKLQNEKFLKK